MRTERIKIMSIDNFMNMLVQVHQADSPDIQYHPTNVRKKLDTLPYQPSTAILWNTNTMALETKDENCSKVENWLTDNAQASFSVEPWNSGWCTLSILFEYEGDAIRFAWAHEP